MSVLFRGSRHSYLYSKFRPLPPVSLIKYIISYLEKKVKPPFQNAVDIGCGTGQSTIVLAPYFQNVAGVDISEAQIENARHLHKSANIYYRIGPADKLEFADSSVDLVSAAQSFHWFNYSKVFEEINRILIPNGVLAVYGYWVPLPKLEAESKTEQIKQLIIDHLHNDCLGSYWDSGRYTVEKQYADISLPFSDHVRKKFDYVSISTITDYIGYLSTWSAYEKFYQKDSEQATAVLKDIQERLMKLLDVTTAPEVTTLSIHTDYFLLLGRK